MKSNQKLICSSCVVEPFLVSTISKNGHKNSCSYCSSVSNCLPLSDISDLVEAAFQRHYRQVDETDPRSNGQPIIDAISDAARIDVGIALDVQSTLEGRHSDRRAYKEGTITPFCSESYYEELGTDGWEWQERWLGFEQALKTDNRFFCKSALDVLSDVFHGIDSMATPIIIDAGPQAETNYLYRARCFQSDEKLKTALERPDRELGPPPSESALGGRMNAHGISVFYGADDPKAALGEVRPPVGSHVVIARFEFVRNLRILDLTALTKIEAEGSIFDPEFKEELERTAFLQTLCDRIAIPVMPEHEQFEYLATQAVADFLSSNSDFNIDGIAFPAIQSTESHLNFVLFRKSARVEKIEIADGVTVRASLGYPDEDGWFDDFGVEKIYPPKKKESAENEETQPGPLEHPRWTPIDPDTRMPSLRIDLNSIVVHKVKGVAIGTWEHEVTRISLESVPGQARFLLRDEDGEPP